MNIIKIQLSVVIAFSTFFSLSAGTIFFKDGSKLSDIEIISIAEGLIVIEKDKKRKSYPTKLLKAYYNSNIKSGEESDPDKYLDYKVNIIDIKVPDKGIDSKDKTESVTIEYTISKKSGEGKRIKVPYFYFYVLVPSKDGYGERAIYSYYSPSDAKISSKGYDAAAILEKVLEFGRHTWDMNHAKLTTKLMGKTVSFSLKSVGNRKILAWHLEVWGNKDKIYEKSTTVHPERGISKNWWLKLKN